MDTKRMSRGKKKEGETNNYRARKGPGKKKENNLNSFKSVSKVAGSNSNPAKSNICFAFQKGNCSRGDGCKFSHDTAVAGSNHLASSSYSKRKHNSSKKKKRPEKASSTSNRNSSKNMSRNRLFESFSAAVDADDMPSAAYISIGKAFRVNVLRLETEHTIMLKLRVAAPKIVKELCQMYQEKKRRELEHHYLLSVLQYSLLFDCASDASDNGLTIVETLRILSCEKEARKLIVRVITGACKKEPSCKPKSYDKLELLCSLFSTPYVEDLTSMDWLSICGAIIEILPSQNLQLNEINRLCSTMFSSLHAVDAISAFLKLLQKLGDNLEGKPNLLTCQFIQHLCDAGHVGYARMAAGLSNLFHEFVELVSSDFYKPEKLDILIVDSFPKLLQAQSDLLQPGTVVGLDQETKPTFRKGDWQPVSTLQISSRKRCYIIDLLRFDKAHRSHLYMFLSELFQRQDICKIGHGFENDFNLLKKAYPNDSFCFDKCVNLVEVMNVVRGIYPVTNDISLAKLSLFCFGKPLNKQQQMSNWGRRPLHPDQLQYAAIDAYILIKMVDYLSECLQLSPEDCYEKYSFSILSDEATEPRPEPPSSFQKKK